MDRALSAQGRDQIHDSNLGRVTAQAALQRQMVVRDAVEAAHAVPCVGCAYEGFADQLVYSLAHGDGDILRRPRALQFVDAR